MGRQLAVDFGMQPCMVTHVDEISFPCADTFRCRQRFRYALVRRVRLRPQGVYYQNIQSLDETYHHLATQAITLGQNPEGRNEFLYV